MQNTVTVAHDPFAGPAIEKIIPIIQAQAEIWIACKFGGEDASRSYNESVSLILKGELQREALEYAAQQLVARHEALRSTFSPDGRFMTVFEEISQNIFFKDISQGSAADKNMAVQAYLSEDAHYVFDLIKGPLLKIGLLKLSEQEHQLVLTAHHIICDGWSTGIMLEEIGAFYSAHILGATPNVAPPDTFSSFAAEEQEFMNSDAYIETEQYWLKQYESSVPTVSLPTDFPRPELRTFKSNRLDFPIDLELVSALKKVGIKSGASFVVTLMAAFEVFLYRQTGQDDLVLGLPAAGQSLNGKTQLVGHCVNLLPLRSKLIADTPFNAYLKNRKSEIFDAYDHQQFSFGQLLQKLAITRDPSRVPLVPITFNIDMGMDTAVAFNDLSYKLKSNPRAFEAFELFLNATGTEDELILEWSYNTALFKAATIEGMMASFKEVLHNIVANPSVEIGNIIKVDASAYADLNATEVSFPKLPLHELVTEQCQKSPEKPAITFRNQVISYGNLEKQAHQLAHYLIQQGVGPGDYIAVSLPRSIELITTLLAILECGAAYVPLDPSYPSKRLEFMLQDSEAKYMITKESSISALKSDTELLFLETIFAELEKYPSTPIELKVDSDDIAYLLYTSGSTGKPKGVSVSHKNIVNLLSSVLVEPGIQETDRILSITTISFDIAGFELYGALLKGAELVLTNEETSKDPRLLLDILRNDGITMLEATPATWQMLLDSGWKEKLPIRALCTGEALPLVLAKKIVGKVNELWNLYGPTETTIWSSLTKVSPSAEIITIGRPIANTQFYIVNEQGNLVEPGKIGELYIAGDGVAKGYWKRPDLTAEKFVKNTFDEAAGSIVYRTGDLAKLLPSGEVQCLGRIDQQIKIRGHRIELGEIEQALDSLEGIESSVVLFHEDKLVANLLTTKTGTVSEEDQLTIWKQTLRNQLPMHMVPQQFNLVSEFPTTLNGKIDRKKLVDTLPKTKVKTGYTEPASDSEKVIAEVWKKCLKIDNIGVDSDFFELGGHSVIAVRVMTMLEEKTGNRLPLVALLKHPTIKKLAAYMDSEFVVWDSLVPLKPEGTKPPLYIVHGAHHNVLIFNELAKNLDKDQPVYGLQARGLDGVAEPHDSMYQMATDYLTEIIASNPDGPYALAGFSLGGTIAFEMARQLKAMGKEVKMVGEFDTYVFPDYYFESPIKKKIVDIFYILGKIVFITFNMFTSKKKFKRRTGLIKLFVSGLFLRMKYGKEKQVQMQHNRLLKMESNHYKATSTYVIEPQDIVIDLFKAEEQINFVHDDKFLGWKKMARKGIRKHMVPGNHIDMFDKGNVEVFAKHLQHVLDNHNAESVQ